MNIAPYCADPEKEPSSGHLSPNTRKIFVILVRTQFVKYVDYYPPPHTNTPNKLEVINSLCPRQQLLSMKFIMLINVKMPTVYEHGKNNI